jgi:DNA-binding HxlR family transcriptional regulator
MCMEDGTSTSLGHLEGTTSPHDAQDWDARQWDVREGCEVRQILDRIAGKWSLLVVALLADRTLRFSELRREIDGVSQRMLTATLRQLERDGLVARTVYPVVPPRVEYALTPLGRSLHATVQALVTWTEANEGEIAAARATFDAMSQPVPARL